MTVRVSAVDWFEGGLGAEDSVVVAQAFAAHGVDAIDVSTGQTVAEEQPSFGRSYQTPFADRIRNVAGIPTIAVGAISGYDDVNSIILAGRPAPPAPYLTPQTLQPMGPADLAPIFPQAIIAQEVSAEPWIEIPDQVRDIYRMWRPSPVYRADRLERALDTPAHIYFKYEGVSPAGSHKPNTAVPQAYYNAKEGVKRLTTETGAGQWGSALAFAGALFGLEVTVYMVKVSYEQKPYRRAMMETWGATVHASPTELTNAGRGILKEDPDSPGSLGIAISEAVEDAATHDDAKYSLGSVVNHVLLHQTVMGQEAKKQMEMACE